MISVKPVSGLLAVSSYVNYLHQLGLDTEAVKTLALKTKVVKQSYRALDSFFTELAYAQIINYQFHSVCFNQPLD